MKKNFKASDYLNESSNIVLRDAIEFWEEDRCASGASDIYLLEDPEDFKLFIDCYDIPTAIECYEKSIFWFGGTNYPKPYMTTAKDLIKILDDEYDFDYVKKLLECGYAQALARFFNLNALYTAIYSHEYMIKINSTMSIEELIEILDKVIDNFNYTIIKSN